MSKTINETTLDSLIKNHHTTNLKEVLTQGGYFLPVRASIIKYPPFIGKLDLSDMDVSNWNITLPSIGLIILNSNTNLANTKITFQHADIRVCEEFFISSGAILSNTSISTRGSKIVIKSGTDTSSVNIEIEKFICDQDDLIRKHNNILGESDGICKGFVLESARLLKNYKSQGKLDIESTNALYKVLSDSLSEEGYNDFVFMANVFQQSQLYFSDGIFQEINTKEDFNSILCQSDSYFFCVSFQVQNDFRHSIGVRTFSNSDGSIKYQIIDPNKGFLTLSTFDDCKNNLYNTIAEHASRKDEITINILDAYQFIQDGLSALAQVPHPEIALFKAVSGETTYDFLKMFLEKGGDKYINFPIDNSTPLNEAKNSQNHKVIDLLLKYIENDGEQKTDFATTEPILDVFNNLEIESQEIKVSGDSPDVDI